MKRSLLAETWSFLRGRPDHPIYRREMKGWSYLRAWRGARRGCVPVIGAIIVLMAGCCSLFMLPVLFDSPQEGLAILPLALIYGLLFGGEIVRWLTGLVATGLTATTISAEMEAQSYAFLRLTPIPTREVVLAKYSAAVREVRTPVIAVMVTRLGTIIIGAIYLAILSVVAMNNPTFGGAPSSSGAPGGAPVELLPLLVDLTPVLGQGVLAVASLCIAGVIWLIYFLLQPVLDVLLFSAVGLLASSLARTRGSGLLVAGGIRLGLWAASYVASQILSLFLQLLVVPLAYLPTAPLWLNNLTTAQPGPVIAVLVMLSIVWLVIVVLAEMGFTLFLLYLTDKRAERLPFPA